MHKNILRCLFENATQTVIFLKSNNRNKMPQGYFFVAFYSMRISLIISRNIQKPVWINIDFPDNCGLIDQEKKIIFV